MRYIFSSLFFFLSSALHATTIFTSYETYYSQLNGGIFTKALEKSTEEYSMKDEHGMCGEDDSCQDQFGVLGSKKIRLTFSLTKGIFKINGWHFSYKNAKALDDVKNSSDEVSLHEISAYVAEKNNNHPDMVCIEGYYMGSKRFRLSEVFLIINPLDSKKKIQFFHLPNLHSSCLAIQGESKNSFSYPNNNYIPQDDIDQSTGLIIKWQTITNNTVHSSGRETKLRFIEIGNPFKFSIL